eukprot:Gregarina_sp_Poly_1__3548@NODE_2037_length_2801_cov_97_328822_g1314_i0_p1_GENE_NODE_2037_length_2801_cov_97_328822_g1314_i0NODE_2037_length_2801_cov_97_328822_g1314_i0_p1_ORF_typecomplete_len560_score69_41RIO1/PF01163_22/3_6e55Kdo/PF06293_14/1_2e03Kdo/PF06293_14/7_2e05Pkinase_fungal/PF17667_1/0_02Pkinase_fungal/PF17667_1/1_6e03_NODE_2037_length_2801_cov_97_328822_g1314_i011202763
MLAAQRLNNHHVSSRHAVLNEIEKAEKKRATCRSRGLTRDTRATVEGALDRRTLDILAKLKKAGFYLHLHGCISTGKEANVYAADAEIFRDGHKAAMPRAIKVFHTSRLKFRKRREYVEADYRFRRAYQGSANPRKMAPQWAEKEFRNLKRLVLTGMRCPIPIQLRGHVFVMSMIGRSSDEAAPRLKDLICDDVHTWKRCYIEVITFMRLFYQECKLIHGDLSEYNLLFYCGHPYIIDVSQSMDTSNNNCNRFLRRDCVNITTYFQQKVFEHKSDYGHNDIQESDDSLSQSNSSDDEKSISDLDSTASENASISEVGTGLEWNFPNEDSELYKRTLRSNKILIPQFVEEENIRAKMNGLESLLTWNELFDFVTSDNIEEKFLRREKLSRLENIWWPEYDWAERDGDSFIWNSSERTDIHKDESKLIVNAFVDNITMTHDQYQMRRSQFRLKCQEALAYTLARNQLRPTAQEQGLLEFLHQAEPNSLAEVIRNGMGSSPFVTDPITYRVRKGIGSIPARRKNSFYKADDVQPAKRVQYRQLGSSLRRR